MIKTALASTALFAAHALAQGAAVVINDCSHDTYIQNTPGGGGSPIAKTLAPGGSYRQTWNALSSGGWSIKIAPTSDSDWINDILQYEYTLTGSTIWFDISEVNGSPFGGKQHISADNGCSVKQTAYRNPTDDEYGMQQSCGSSSTVQVNLCSGKGGAAPAPAPPAPHHHHHGKHHHKHPKPAPPPPADTSYVAPTTSVAPAEVPTTTATPTWDAQHHWGGPPAANEKLEAAGSPKEPAGKIGKNKGKETPAPSPPAGAAVVTQWQYTTLHTTVTAYA